MAETLNSSQSLNARQLRATRTECAWSMPEVAPGWKSRLFRAPLLGRLFLALKIARDALLLAREFAFDYSRALRHTSAVFTGNTQPKISALITMGYHGVEKGLALPAPRPGFGKADIHLLISRLETYRETYGFDGTAQAARSALQEYARFNQRAGAVDPEIQRRIDAFCNSSPAASESGWSGGTRVVRRGEFLGNAKRDLTGFFYSRSSVRQYSSEPVDLADVRAAVEIAGRSPSCCNRQSGRAWVLTDRPRIQQALEIQGGARGFAGEVPLLIIVTSGLDCFQSPGERSQALIDGGLFAMSLVYGLHSRGLVTCCLNWSKTHALDRKFRRVFEVPSQEAIIMLISVGHPKHEYRVACSCRMPADQVMRLL